MSVTEFPSWKLGFGDNRYSELVEAREQLAPALISCVSLANRCQKARPLSTRVLFLLHKYFMLHPKRHVTSYKAVRNGCARAVIFTFTFIDEA